MSDTFVRVVNSTGTYDFAYIKHEGQLVAQVQANGNTEFVHGDHEGSSTVVTDSLGNAIENSSYEPFGALISGGQKTRFDYEGKEYDSVVRHYDFHARPYDPWLKQFVQADTLIQNVHDPQSLNRYAFERNNPYRYVDEDGHNWFAVVYYAVELIVAIAEVVGLLFLSKELHEEQKEGQEPATVPLNTINAATPEEAEALRKAMEKSKKEEEEKIVKVKKIDTTDPNAPVVTYQDVKVKDLDNVRMSLVSSGWTPVLDEEGEIDYYCVGTGCPGQNGGDDGDQDENVKK